MRKTVLFVVGMSMLLLGPAVFAQNKPTEQPKEQAGTPTQDKTGLRNKVRERAAGTAQGTQGQARKEIAAEMIKVRDQLKTDLGELQVIKQFAVKENARQTAEALTRLIARREARYAQQIQMLQRQSKLLDGKQAGKSGVEGQAPPETLPTPDDKSPKAGPKTERAKPQNSMSKP